MKCLASGGIIANYLCPASCGHCLYGCSPAAEPGYIDEATAENLCGHLRRLGCSGLHIGGGEPFLDVNRLRKLIQIITKSGLPVDYIETNAAWISGDDERNRRITADVIHAGGNCIMVSADPFHVEFIPFWKPKALIRILREMGIPHFVWQERYLPMLHRLDPHQVYDGIALRGLFGYDVISRCAREYGMNFNGRALNLLRKLGSRKDAREFTGPCAELCSTSHFHVDFLGRYIPPGCTGIGILMEDVGKELDPARYPTISRLLSGGVSCLLEYARKLGYKAAPDGYASKCELCFSIRKYLAASAGQGHLDLTPEYFYHQNF
ncbi:MAG: radical SAM protein [Clostridia bacterium]|nr:radical SAM protein [Clostridia bacterium]